MPITTTTNMRDFSVLMTSCSPRKTGIIHCLKDNGDGANVKVYCTNCDKNELPSLKDCDGTYLVPRNDSSEYINALLSICKELDIDILIPRLSSELETIASNIVLFEQIGVKVSVTNLVGLTISNNKVSLYERYYKLMPYQVMGVDSSTVREFANTHSSFCCKLPKSSGAAGFAIVDNHLCNDVNLFHAYGKKHYISVEHLCHIVDSQKINYILQDYISGKDYTVSLLADNGKVTHICGYIGHEMEYSCIMQGEIKTNEMAFEISRRIVSDLNLSGNIGIDFILKDNGDVLLLEVNPRMNATLPFVAKAGCNMPYLRCKQLLGYDITHEGQEVKEGLKMRKKYVAEYYV